MSNKRRSVQPSTSVAHLQRLVRRRMADPACRCRGSPQCSAHAGLNTSSGTGALTGKTSANSIATQTSTSPRRQIAIAP